MIKQTILNIKKENKNVDLKQGPSPFKMTVLFFEEFNPVWNVLVFSFSVCFCVFNYGN